MKRSSLKLTPVTEETLSASEFLRRIEEKGTTNIASSNIVLPHHGNRRFGGIHVRYKHPELRSRPIRFARNS